MINSKTFPEALLNTCSLATSVLNLVLGLEITLSALASTTNSA